MRPLSPLPDWISLEHQVQRILTDQEIHGWYFDERKAQQLGIMGLENMTLSKPPTKPIQPG